MKFNRRDFFSGAVFGGLAGSVYKNETEPNESDEHALTSERRIEEQERAKQEIDELLGEGLDRTFAAYPPIADAIRKNYLKDLEKNSGITYVEVLFTLKSNIRLMEEVLRHEFNK